MCCWRPRSGNRLWHWLGPDSNGAQGLKWGLIRTDARSASSHAVPMRYLFRFEAEHLLVRAGFAIEHLYAGYDESEFGSTDPGELVFVATKAEC